MVSRTSIMRQRLYRHIAGWVALLSLTMVLSGAWLFLLHTNGLLAMRYVSLETWLEIAVPHLIGMGSVAFILLHFFLFINSISSRLLLSIIPMIYLFILIDAFSTLSESILFKSVSVSVITVTFAAISIFLLTKVKDEG